MSTHDRSQIVTSGPRLDVLALAYHDGGDCTHDLVTMTRHAEDDFDALCEHCELPVVIADEVAFALFYEAEGRTYHRCWAPECPTCGAAMTPWVGAQGFALVCTVGDEDACPPVEWSDTLLGLYSLHALEVCER